ncbi:MAG: hypothetical protein H7Y20_13695 [Bryobacteraceae bacterium]|nr:hypothetical protein [Bryobacteraceae bacterium]
MSENYRRFEAGPDPFGRTWTVEFRWLQVAISIRHSDTIDVKFQLRQGEDTEEKVIALPHPDLVAVSKNLGRPLTDPWCMKVAAIHLREMIVMDSDMDKDLITVTAEDLLRHANNLGRPVGAPR